MLLTLHSVHVSKHLEKVSRKHHEIFLLHIVASFYFQIGVYAKDILILIKERK